MALIKKSPSLPPNTEFSRPLQHGKVPYKKSFFASTQMKVCGATKNASGDERESSEKLSPGEEGASRLPVRQDSRPRASSSVSWGREASKWAWHSKERAEVPAWRLEPWSSAGRAPGTAPSCHNAAWCPVLSSLCQGTEGL